MVNNELTEMLIKITRAEVEDDTVFQSIFLNFINNFGISILEIGNALLISQATIINWKEGKSLPRVNTRKVVRSYILKQIRTRLTASITTLEKEKQLISQLAETIEDFLAQAVNDRSKDVPSLNSQDDLVIRARRLIAEAGEFLQQNTRR